MEDTKVEGCDLVYLLLSDYENEEVWGKCRAAFGVDGFEECNELNYLIGVCRVEENTDLIIANAQRLFKTSSVVFLRKLLSAMTAAQQVALFEICPEAEAYA